MKYHDFKLQGYTVEDSGTRISLNLVYDYPNTKKEISCITFIDVTLYDFNHTSEAIITDIEDFDIFNMIKHRWKELELWNKYHKISHWDPNPEKYFANLKNNEYKGWEITSAIGFYGFVIAKNVQNT